MRNIVCKVPTWRCLITCYCKWVHAGSDYFLNTMSLAMHQMVYMFGIEFRICYICYFVRGVRKIRDIINREDKRFHINWDVFYNKTYGEFNASIEAFDFWQHELSNICPMRRFYNREKNCFNFSYSPQFHCFVQLVFLVEKEKVWTNYFSSMERTSISYGRKRNTKFSLF